MAEVINQPPLYYGYKGGYANVTQCEECGAVGLYEDNHPANPCYWCGGEVDEISSAKWIKPIKKWDWSILWFKTIESGYWEKPNGEKFLWPK